MEGNPAPGRMTPPVPTLESVPIVEQPTVATPPVPEPSLTTPTIEATQSETQKTPDNLTGEQVKEQLDTRWDRLTNWTSGLLWKNESGEINNLLHNDIALYEKVLKENPDLVKRGIYREASNEPGKQPISEKTNSDLIARVLEECEKYSNNPEIQAEYQTLQEHILVHGIQGESAPMTFRQWKEKGKPTGEFRFKAEGTKPVETQSANQASSEAKSPETAEADEAFIQELRDKAKSIGRLIRGKLGWEYSPFPSENQRLADANKEYPGKVINNLYQGRDFESLSNASPEALLRWQYEQNELEIMIYETQVEADGMTLTSAQQADIGRLAGEQERIKRMLGNPDKDKLPKVDSEFAQGGRLDTQAKRKTYSFYRDQFRDQADSLLKQSKDYDKNTALAIKIGGHVFEPQWKDINSGAKMIGMATAAAMFLLFLEGEKEKPQAGGGMMGH